MDNDNGRVRQRPADPWEALADANLEGDGRAARQAWRRVRARWLLPLDAVFLAGGGGREQPAATAVHLGEYAADGAR